MRMASRTNNQDVMLLLDTGSTHNFISQAVVKRLNMKCVPQNQVKVKVASGAHIASGGVCKQLTVRIQGFTFRIDFYVLDLNNYDAVLGTNWFKSLGPI